MMRIANTEALAATVAMVLSISGTVFPITDVLFRARWAALAAGAIGGLASMPWWGVPPARCLGGEGLEG